jgi:hypothetical protein
MVRPLFILSIVVLLAALGLQVSSCTRLNNDPDRAPLTEIIFARSSHWVVEDRLVADTPEMKKAVGELLNFDESLLRTYRKGAKQFDVYVAYWRPGKMSERLVAGHTPDVCWVAGGWTMMSRQAPSADVVTSAEFSPAGQYRLFNDPGSVRRWVVFWHRAGGKLINYHSESGVPPWWTVFNDLITQGFKPRTSQYFVRVSSDTPWEDLAKEPEFREVMRSLHVLLQ